MAIVYLSNSFDLPLNLGGICVEADHQAGYIGDICSNGPTLNKSYGVGITGSAAVNPAWVAAAVGYKVVAVLTAGALGPAVGLSGGDFPVQRVGQLGVDRPTLRHTGEHLPDE